MSIKEDSKAAFKAFGNGLAAKAGEAVKSDTAQYAVLGFILGMTLGIFIGIPQLSLAGLCIGVWKGLTK